MVNSKQLNAKVLGNRGVKLTMKNGVEKVGYVPFSNIPSEYEEKYLYFVDWTNFEFLEKIISDGGKVDMGNIKEFTEAIDRNEVEKFRILESEIRQINSFDGKPIPDGFTIGIKESKKPGHVTAIYGLPGVDKEFEIGDLEILNGALNIPITLAFLSYAKEDREQVRSIMDDLHDYGVLTWFDEKDLLPGDDWEEKILEAIEKSDYFFLFLSSKSLNRSGYKNKELKYALEQADLRPLTNKKFIIPILLDDCEPPRELRSIQWIKVTEDGWFKKVIASIGESPLLRAKKIIHRL